MSKKAINWEAMGEWKERPLPGKIGERNPKGQNLQVTGSKFTEKDRKNLLACAKSFIPEDFERIVLSSSRILIAATYNKELRHTVKTEKGWGTERYVGQVVAISLDEKADQELDWSLASSIASIGQLDSDRAWAPLFGVIETFANLMVVDGRQVFYTPNKEVENPTYQYNMYSKDLCYISEWTPRDTWFEDHWDRPSLHTFKNIYDTAKRFVYEPLGEEFDE